MMGSSVALVNDNVLLTSLRGGAPGPILFWNTYSSAPYPDGLDGVSLDGLPAEFRHYVRAA